MRIEEFGVISDQEVYEAIRKGEIIAAYPDDTPYPSVLVFGITETNRPLHIVCAHNPDDDEIVIITVYQPDPNRWEEDYRRRKK